MIGIHRIKDIDADTFDMGKVNLWGNNQKNKVRVRKE